jgi:gamma-glutamyltranspeptidase/glutathione hydrolase
MTPTIVEGPRGVAILGTPGGSRIITMVTLGVLAWVDGLPPGEIPALPRFHHQFLPDRIQHEPGALPDPVRQRLAEMGHTLDETDRRFGNMNIVTWERESGVVTAVTDPRNESLVDF